MTLLLRQLVDSSIGLGSATPIVLQGPNSDEEFHAHMEMRGLNDPQSHPRIVLVSEGIMGGQVSEMASALSSGLVPPGYTLVPKAWADAKEGALIQWYGENPDVPRLTISPEGIIIAPGGQAIGTVEAGITDPTPASDEAIAKAQEAATPGGEGSPEEEAKEEAERITSQVVPEPGTNTGEGTSSDQEPGGAGNTPSEPGSQGTTASDDERTPGPEPTTDTSPSTEPVSTDVPAEDEDFTDLDKEEEEEPAGNPDNLQV